jgi:MFS family permease
VEIQDTQQRYIETTIPARLDRLPWSKWHWLIVFGLGITWILDGLQVTLQGAIGAALQSKVALGLTEHQIGLSATCYLAGAVPGALLFGYATDRFGRKKLFFITLTVYLCAAFLTAFAWNFESYCFFLALSGAGIGGECAAVNSAIDELIPARLRGTVDLAINSTYWAGAIIGSFATIFLLNPSIIPEWLGWRLSFGIGAFLGLGILLVRRWIPESPRWLIIAGKEQLAEKIVDEVEAEIEKEHGTLPPITEPAIKIVIKKRTSLWQIFKVLFFDNRKRAFLGLSLMVSQAFFYNSIFFTYALVLSHFYHIAPSNIGHYIVPFALGNWLGPIILGRLFDLVGRKIMITATYALSGILLAITASLFQQGLLTAETQSLAWVIIFFFASAAASSAYLTVSELFPLELRAMAIAVFYAVGTLVGGVAAPAFFSDLIAAGSKDNLAFGYYIGAALMIFAALIEVFFGVAAERKSLESISPPLAEID